MKVNVKKDMTSMTEALWIWRWKLLVMTLMKPQNFCMSNYTNPAAVYPSENYTNPLNGGLDWRSQNDSIQKELSMKCDNYDIEKYTITFLNCDLFSKVTFFIRAWQTSKMLQRP